MKSQDRESHGAQHDLSAGHPSIRARNISDRRNQLIDALLFIPVLFGAVIVGLALLIFNFWLANWKPSLVRGLFALICFAAAPMTAFIVWQRWKSRPNAADTVLIVRPEFLEVVALDGPKNARRIAWENIESCKVRSLTAFHQALRIKGHTETSFVDRFVIEFAFCADLKEASDFIELIDSRCSKNRE